MKEKRFIHIKYFKYWKTDSVVAGLENHKLFLHFDRDIAEKRDLNNE